jgi:hypothetical protein
MDAFLWKSQNGKLYGSKELTSFGVKDDVACQCGATVQTFEHIMLLCSFTEQMFKNNLKKSLGQVLVVVKVDRCRYKQNTIGGVPKMISFRISWDGNLSGCFGIVKILDQHHRRGGGGRRLM